MNLVLVMPGEADAEGKVRLEGRRARHLVSVLRVRPGSIVRIGELNGPTGTADVLSVEPGAVVVRCVLDSGPPEIPRVNLLLALPRPKVMKRLWAPLAAMGVGRIVITNAARVERNYFDTHVLGSDFFCERMCEGLEQAGDTRLPEVRVRLRLKPLVEDELESERSEGEARFMADLMDAPGWSRVWSEHGCRANGAVWLAVGPEGGWVDFERDLLRAHGFVPYSMGPRILRSDTACLAALVLAHESLRAGIGGCGPA